MLLYKSFCHFKVTLLIHLLIIWVIQLFLYRFNLYRVLQGKSEVNADFRVRIAFHSAVEWNWIVPGLKLKASADLLYYICTPACTIHFHRLLPCARLGLCTWWKPSYIYEQVASIVPDLEEKFLQLEYPSVLSLLLNAKC